MQCPVLFVRLVVALGLVVAVAGVSTAPSVATAAPVEQALGATMAFQDDDDDDDDDDGGVSGGVVAVPRTGVGSATHGVDGSGGLAVFGALAALFGGLAYLRRDGLLTR